jgi:hypothetical protein
MKPCFCVANPHTSGFNLDYYEKEFGFHFAEEVKVKATTMLRCQQCNALWLREDTLLDKWCHRITSLDQFDLVNEWLTVDTTATHLKITAEQIGTSSVEFSEYPCKATLKTGEIRDICVLTRWTHHPRASWPSMRVSHFLYASQVASIEPSEYAISLTNRIAMRNAMEMEYRDYVHLVFEYSDDLCFRDQGNMKHYFDSNFIRYKNVKGSDIRFVSQDMKKYDEAKDKDDLKNEVTLILFDEW